MKRRSFIQKVSSASSVFLVNPAGMMDKSGRESIKSHTYPEPQNLEDILTKENQVMLRFELRAQSSPIPVMTQFKFEVFNGILDRKKHYFFDDDQNVTYNKSGFTDFLVNQAYPRIIVAWINNATEETAISLFLDGKEKTFSLKELISQAQVEFGVNEVQVTANYLLDHEIAFISPDQLGIKEPSGPFSIAVLADTQGGDPVTSKNLATRIKIHNAFNEDSVQITNGLDPQPAFTLVLGDVVDNQGEKAHFEAMHQYLKEIKSPVLYAVGNHETRYNAQFTPGYNMEEFNNYIAAQKAVNGTDLLLYSFNLGKWHFVIWPDPLRDHFWETHPHYFDWLERDLEKHKDVPVMFMQHVPAHPIGIDPLINYAESIYVKRHLLNIISRHGNVKYVFSGHVHIPIRASMKTAVHYKGMNMINLPAAGYRPRAFGEEELFGGPSQGVMVAKIKDTKAEIYFKTVTEEVFRYPDRLPDFNEQEYPLWLTYKWQLPAEPKIRNGNFVHGLLHWEKRFVYQEDKNPSNIREVRQRDGNNALYLFSKKRGYATPGQDRLPQTINHLSQAIKISKNPGIIEFNYSIDLENTEFNGYSGAFIWIEGFQTSFKTLDMAYWIGKPFGSLQDKCTKNQKVPLLHFNLPESRNRNIETRLNLVRDYESYGQDFNELNLDKLIINIGTWNINDGEYYPYGVYFDDFRFQETFGKNIHSKAGDVIVGKTTEEEIWWMRNNHIAGEHKYHSPTENVKGI